MYAKSTPHTVHLQIGIPVEYSNSRKDPKKGRFLPIRVGSIYVRIQDILPAQKPGVQRPACPKTAFRVINPGIFSGSFGLPLRFQPIDLYGDLPVRMFSYLQLASFSGQLCHLRQRGGDLTIRIHARFAWERIKILHAEFHAHD